MFSSTTKIGEFTNLESRITNCRITLFHHERHRYIYMYQVLYICMYFPNLRSQSEVTSVLIISTSHSLPLSWLGQPAIILCCRAVSAPPSFSIRTVVACFRLIMASCHITISNQLKQAQFVPLVGWRYGIVRTDCLLRQHLRQCVHSIYTNFSYFSNNV